VAAGGVKVPCQDGARNVRLSPHDWVYNGCFRIPFLKDRSKKDAAYNKEFKIFWYSRHFLTVPGEVKKKLPARLAGRPSKVPISLQGVAGQP
jgi:hypothetical protein